MNMKRYACTLLVLSAVSTGPAFATNLLSNPSFEAFDASASPFFVRSFSSLPDWTQIGDGVDLIHNDYTQPTLPVLVDASDGVQFLDMNQANAIGGIYQDVAVTQGQQYKLTLDASKWATNSGGSILYSLIDATDQSIIASETYAVTEEWVERTLIGTATSNALRVQVQTATAVQAGPGVDNLSLTVVPEPSSLALLAIGTALIARRRR